MKISICIDNSDGIIFLILLSQLPTKIMIVKRREIRFEVEKIDPREPTLRKPCLKRKKSEIL